MANIIIKVAINNRPYYVTGFNEEHQIITVGKVGLIFTFKEVKIFLSTYLDAGYGLTSNNTNVEYL